MLTPLYTIAQNCERDSNILVTGGLLSPAPWSPDSAVYNLNLACINEPYNQSVTINVPPTFVYQGTPIGLVNVSIPTTDGIGNYPAGMQYTCDPPNCVFPASTLGCILLHGTPDASNPSPDTLDLTLTASVLTVLLPVPLPVTFPGDPSAPDDHYYLILNPTGQCVSATGELGSPFSAVRAVPNPVSQHTRIEVQSTQTGTFLFEVFNLVGKRIYTEKVQLYEGANQFDYDASQLPNGTYLYSIGNADGKSTRRLIKI